MPRRTAPIGAHISVAGGLGRCLPRADAIGAEALQVFVANPRGWAPPAADPDGDEGFRASCSGRQVPVFVHAPYLINFGSPSPDTLERSCAALEFSLRRGAAIGAAGVVMHAGSAVRGNEWDAAMWQVRARVLPVLDVVDGPPLLIEPTAG
ncbi:MAG: Endonuclease, partial [Pseudonocardiales bacterium]|nr:Endonuclease [Pseudonocardiales bacterium]